jgi:two-component system cell cycle response regulator
MANEVSERIRALMIEEGFTAKLQAKSFHVTCSFGVAIANRAPWNSESILASADQALYAAKNSGRNKVLTADIIGAKLESQS